MNELVLNQKDLLVMNLVNYFMTDKNYNPIIVHGVKDEIWLENMECDYKIIRIVTHYIHNDEQLSYDKFKLKKVVGKLKTKTLSFKMPVLNIYTDLGDAVNSLENDSNYFDVFVKKISFLYVSVEYTILKASNTADFPELFSPIIAFTPLLYFNDIPSSSNTLKFLITNLLMYIILLLY